MKFSNQKKGIIILAVFFFLFLANPNDAFAAARYWVGGGSSTNWNATGNTNWSDTSGGANNASVPGSTDDVIFDANSGAGTSNISASITVASVTMTNFTGTLTHGTASLTIASGGGITFGASMTYTPSNSSISGNIGNLTTAGKLMPNITVSSGTLTLQDNLTFIDSKSAQVTIVGALNLNGFTMSGYSSTSRVLVTSNILGVQRSVTRASGAFANADFRDIDLEASYDCSAITGLCGDAGGNSADFTFTTATTNYWVGGTGNWSDVNEWANSSGGTGGTGRVPLPQDDVIFDNNSFSGNNSVSLDMPRLGKNIDASAYNEGNTPILANNITSNTIYGSLTLNSSITSFSSSPNLTFEGRGAYTLTSAGKSFGSGTVSISMVSGSLTLQDAYVGSFSLTLNNGNLDANDFNVTAASVSITGTGTRTLDMGTGTWTVTTTGTIWNASTATNLTLNEETSTIVVSNTSSASKTWAGGFQTYYNLSITGRNIQINQSNTFNTLSLDNGGVLDGVILASGTTQTVTNFTTNASAGNVAILSGVAGGGAESLSVASGTICVDYLTITNVTATGGASWYAGANSTDNGGNSGWTFSACPGGDPNSASRQYGVPNEKVRGGTKVRGGVKFR